MRYITWFLIFLMFVIGITPGVDAGLSPSEVIAISKFDRTIDLQRIQKFIEIKLVSERLGKLGFTQDEIKAKLSQFSDQQVHQIAQNLDNLKVGGDGGVIIALLLIAILVVLLLQLTGHKIIVTKPK